MKIIFLLLAWGTLFFVPKRNEPEESGILVNYRVQLKPFKSKSYMVTETTKQYILDNKSVFLDEKLAKHLNMKEENLSPTEREHKNKEIGLPRFNYIVIKDYTQQKYNLIQEHFAKEYIGYEEPLFDRNSWNILSDTSTISNILTYKATCRYGGRDWIAWFTTEIPVSDGPYKFSGLPGLILKLESDDGDYIFSIIGIEKFRSFSNIPTYAIVPTKKFLELIKLSSNPILKMESNGVQLGTVKLNGKVLTREEWIIRLNKDIADKNHIEKL